MIRTIHFFSGIFSQSLFADFASFLSCLRLIMTMNPTIATMKQSIPIIENTITLCEPSFGDFFSSNFSFLSYWNKNYEILGSNFLALAGPTMVALVTVVKILFILSIWNRFIWADLMWWLFLSIWIPQISFEYASI